MKKPIVWTIAGSDSSGAAGIQADLKTFHALGVHGCSVITAVTAQNTHELKNYYFTPAENMQSQLEILKKDLPTNVIKIGMLGLGTTINILANFLQHYSGSIVLDPVMIASSGKSLFVGDKLQYITLLKTIFPYVTILTPNIPEAEYLLGYKIETQNAIEQAARDLLSWGVKNVFIKGGHFSDSQWSQDFWTNGKESFWLTSPRAAHLNYRGTGCTLSSAIAAAIALGYEIKDALVIAKMYINQCIRMAEILHDQTAFILHQGWPEQERDLPYLSLQPNIIFSEKFLDCGAKSLGLYPVVDSADWVCKLLEQGVSTIQLRIKNKTGADLEKEIKKSITYSQKHNARLFINDYWEYAIQFNAYGVHLGQEDLNSANIGKIHQAGLRLGISTHCYYEVARAHAFQPSYMACGPIYPTTSKVMPFAPQGIAKLKRWRRTLSYPLVAIGGINLERIDEVLATKIDGVALISAIIQDSNPDNMTQQLLAKVSEYQ